MVAISSFTSDDFYTDIEQALQTAKNDRSTLPKLIVNEPFAHPKEMALLFMGFLCYFVVDHSAETLALADATNNDYYQQAVAGYDFEHTNFVVPFTAKDNSMIQAALTQQPVSLTNWDALRRPTVDDGVARLNQATSGIAYTIIMPIGQVGVLGFNFFQPKEMLSPDSETFVTRYSQLVTQILM